MSRRHIPLSTRYAVLCAQADPATVARINRSGRSLIDRYAMVKAVARCRISGEALSDRCEFDHILCVEFGGSNDADNLQALTPAAHRRKTDSDLAMIAKSRRVRLHHETGRSSAAKQWRKMKGRGFDRTMRKKMDGSVIRND